MRLNSTTYPAYMKLQERDTLHLEIDEHMYTYFGSKKLMHILVFAQKCFDSVGDNIYYLTDTFNDAIIKNEKKLLSLFKGHGEIKPKSVFRTCLIIHRLGFIMHRFYESDMGIFTEVFFFNKKSMIGYGMIPHHPQTTHPDTWGMVSTDDYSSVKSLFQGLYMNYIMILAFMENCETDIITLMPNKKSRINGNKYYNEEGKSNVKILDCRWFREICIDSPFAVKGHLRWQPVGEGRIKKRLIWVDAFEKKGYHRKATKIANPV